MKIYVLDTSVVYKSLSFENGREKVINLFDDAEKNTIKLIAPSLIWYELNNSFVVNEGSLEDVKFYMNVFREQVQSGLVEIFSSSSQLLLEKTVELANLDTGGQGHISSYDATFHALAILENAIFLTADKKHFRKTQKLIGSVELFE